MVSWIVNLRGKSLSSTKAALMKAVVMRSQNHVHKQTFQNTFSYHHAVTVQPPARGARAPTLSGGGLKKIWSLKHTLNWPLEPALLQKLKPRQGNTPLLRGIIHHPINKYIYIYDLTSNILTIFQYASKSFRCISRFCKMFLFLPSLPPFLATYPLVFWHLQGCIPLARLRRSV